MCWPPGASCHQAQHITAKRDGERCVESEGASAAVGDVNSMFSVSVLTELEAAVRIEPPTTLMWNYLYKPQAMQHHHTIPNIPSVMPNTNFYLM